MQRSTALVSLVLLAACDPTSKGGGTGGASSSVTSSDSSSAVSSGGTGGAGGSTSSAVASSSSSSAAGGAGGSGGGSASSSTASATSSSGSGTGGGGGGGGYTVAWTKIITTAPSPFSLDLRSSALSAETPNRLFIGATLRGDYTFAGVTLSGYGPHDASVVLALDSAGNEISNLPFDGGGSIGFFPCCLTTDTANNLLVAGQGSGVNATWRNKLRKYGVSPWNIDVAPYNNNFVNPTVERLEVDAAGNLLALLFVWPPGLDFGSGLQSGYLLHKRDGATGSYLWSKPAPAGLMHRDASGNLLFFSGGTPPKLTKTDSSGATLSTKSYVGALTQAAFTSGANGSLVAAQFQGTVDFGCGTLTSAGSGDNLLVVKLDAAGACVYSKRFGPTSFPYGAPYLALTSAGDAVVIGENETPVDFGGGPVPAGQFVLRLDPAGAFVSTWSMAVAARAAIDAAGAVYFVSSLPSFDVGTGPLLGNTKGMAIAKLVP